jgi:hypothetical protein
MPKPNAMVATTACGTKKLIIIPRTVNSPAS